MPDDAVAALGGGTRPLVVITINGHRWRSRVAVKNGQQLIGISRAQRTAAGVELGDRIEMTLELDTEPRTVDEPADLASALDADPDLRRAFDALAFGLRRKHVAHIESSKSEPTRARRIERLVADLT